MPVKQVDNRRRSKPPPREARLCAKPGTVHVCWSHVRRRLYEFAAAAGGGPALIANKTLQRIGRLYVIEMDIHGRDASERPAGREEKGRPIVGALEPWLGGRLAPVVAGCLAQRLGDQRWSAFFCRLGYSPSRDMEIDIPKS
ncbi:MAG: transposase [Rhizobiales bacterium]|nr:transposase [Hyphomicrobiales bacterium]